LSHLLSTSRLVLLRHGQSTWNEANRFTGWYDADLTEAGRAEARRAGELLVEAEVAPDVVHTSVQVRAIRTADLTLDALGRQWIPVRRHWRLNERHYGDLQGKNKAEVAEERGLDQVKVWRRSYDVAPPPLDDDDPRHSRFDPRYAELAPELIPASECLKDVVERMLPYWYDGIVPDLREGRVVLVAAHGNSLRALVKHLEAISDEAIPDVNIPTGLPLVYDLDADLRPADDLALDDRYLGGVEAARAAAEAVARQAG
jgi:2,3-bisphosphoglycerate-dependent phosphoglycerate mutase